MPLSFVKVGALTMAKIRIINGCRLTVGGVNRSCTIGEIVEVPAEQAWSAVGAGQAVPHETLPGVDTKTVPAAKPPAAVTEKPKEK